MTLKTLNLSGIVAGDSLQISVSQGGLTAGPYSVGSWGGLPSDTLGAVLVVNRPHLSCNPESVRFSVDLSAATFDTQGPGAGEYYDARKHELIYLWDFDDAASGDWAAPVKGLPFWKDRNRTIGPATSHMYIQHGTYNPSVLIIEPSSGKTALLTTEITIADQDVVYAGSKTICVNPVGDNDFTDAPAGAVTLNLDRIVRRLNASEVTSEWSSNVGTYQRWLFKRGGTYKVQIALQAEAEGFMIGAYGDPNDPMPIFTGETEQHLHGGYKAAILYTQISARVGPDDRPGALRIEKIHFKGNYDPSEHDFILSHDSGLSHDAMTILHPRDWMISECKIEGFANVSVMQNFDTTYEGHLHISDTEVLKFGGQYPIYNNTSTHPASSLNVSGCRVTLPTDAREDRDNHRALIRANHFPFNNVRDNDFFRIDMIHAIMGVVRAPQSEGLNATVVHNAMEGGNSAMSLCGDFNNGLGRSSVHNMLFEGNVFVSQGGPAEMFLARGTGLTVRNNLFVVPARAHYNLVLRPALRAFLLWESNGEDLPAYVHAAPIRVYNNTFVNLRSDAQNSDKNVTFIEGQIYAFYNSNQPFTNVQAANNIEHQPNIGTPVTGSAPLTTTALWEPWSDGIRPSFGEIRGATIPSTTPDNGSFFVPYWLFVDGQTQLTRAMIDEASQMHRFQVPGKSYRDMASGEFAISFSDTGVTITNTSGTTWAGYTAADIEVYLNDNAPLLTYYGLTGADLPDSQPATGSAALNGATGGNRGWLDVTGAARLTGSDEGTVDDGAWQVS